MRDSRSPGGSGRETLFFRQLGQRGPIESLWMVSPEFDGTKGEVQVSVKVLNRAHGA
jgi:hypothetical protein